MPFIYAVCQTVFEEIRPEQPDEISNAGLMPGMTQCIEDDALWQKLTKGARWRPGGSAMRALAALTNTRAVHWGRVRTLAQHVGAMDTEHDSSMARYGVQSAVRAQHQGTIIWRLILTRPGADATIALRTKPIVGSKAFRPNAAALAYASMVWLDAHLLISETTHEALHIAHRFLCAHAVPYALSLDAIDTEHSFRYRKEIADLIDGADTLFTSRQAANALLGHDTQGAVHDFQAMGAKQVVVTDGMDGAHWRGEESSLHVPVPQQLDVLRHDEASSAFAGGCLAGQAAGLPLREWIRTGHETARRALLGGGGILPAPEDYHIKQTAHLPPHHARRTRRDRVRH